MDGRKKPESEMRRNALSIRWSDSEHRELVDAAWLRRIPASELVRQYVAEGLRRDGAEEAAGGSGAEALLRKLEEAGPDGAAAALGPMLGCVEVPGGDREGGAE